MKSEGAANHTPTMREHEADYTFEVGHRLHAGFFIPASHYIRALKLRGQYLRAFAKAAFAQADLILTPVLAIPVPTIAETTGRTGKAYLDMVVAITRNTKVVNYLGLPAIGVPCGFTSNGLPTSFTTKPARRRSSAARSCAVATSGWTPASKYPRAMPMVGSGAPLSSAAS